MITQIAKTSLIALAVGFIFELVSSWLESDYLQNFFADNLITILIALLAINATTMGIVLTKMRDLIDKHPGGANLFSATRSNMLLAVKEQLALICLAVMILTLQSSPNLPSIENVPLFLDSIVAGIFAYALIILYDTAKGVLIIIDYDL
ncbi:MAG: hypothetical protein H6986_03670 [Pseudomonadales bacterium]|nr:hypothetical protein [Pseudomonadales bacterium]